MVTWKPKDHPRCPEGTDQGGQFMPVGAPKSWCNEGGKESTESSKDGSGGDGSSARKSGRTGSKDRTPEDPSSIKEVKADAGGYLEREIKKRPALRPYEAALNQALYFLKNEDDDFNNDFVARVPLRLRGEAKRALGRALEARGYKVEWTRYEDGSRAPTGIISRPGDRRRRSKEMNRRMRKAAGR